MAPLASMPHVAFDPATMAAFGTQWTANGGALSRSPPYSSIQLGDTIDMVVADSLATMLGGIPVVKASQQRTTQLYPPGPDCVETSPVTVVGGIRKQNFDVVFASWDPGTGTTSTTIPDPQRHPNLRIENFSAQIEDAYRLRYAGSPPH